MAPIPATLITSMAMSLLAFSISMVSMSLTLSELVTKPTDGANCWDDLPCAKSRSCQPSDCIGAQGPIGARGPTGPEGPPGECSCNGTGFITDSMIAANANITRSKIRPGSANHVLINDANGFMSSERWLSTTRGGTGVDSSVSNGTAHVSAGTWTFSKIVDADVSVIAAISRAKLSTGPINEVLYNGPDGIITSEAQLSPFRGGTGIDTTGSTGIARVASGSWFIGTISFSDLSAGVPNSVIVSNQFGFLTNQSQLNTTLGGTGVDSSSSTGVAHVNAGVWSFYQIVNADINATAAIDRSKIACTTPFSILVNDQNGCMSEQATLNATLGGTGINTASSTGIPHVAAGVWSVSQIVNADVSSTAAIVRGKIAATLANEVVINDNLGILTTEPQLSPVRGGTGVDSSSETGFAFVTGGVWSFVPGAVNASGTIMANKVLTPLIEYDGGDLNIIATQDNAAVCLKANGTGGSESICFVIGVTTMGLFTTEGLRLPYLSASQAVVTDSTKNLVSLAYTDAATASTIVSRDGSAASSFGQVNSPVLHSSTALTIEAPSSFISITGLNPTQFSTDADPSTGNTYDLGTSLLTWKNLYISAMVNAPLVEYDAGNMVIKTTQTNATITIAANGTGGGEAISFVVSDQEYLRMGVLGTGGIPEVEVVGASTVFAATTIAAQSIRGILNSLTVTGMTAGSDVDMNFNCITNADCITSTNTSTYRVTDAGQSIVLDVEGGTNSEFIYSKVNNVTVTTVGWQAGVGANALKMCDGCYVFTDNIISNGFTITFASFGYDFSGGALFDGHLNSDTVTVMNPAGSGYTLQFNLPTNGGTAETGPWFNNHGDGIDLTNTVATTFLQVTATASNAGGAVIGYTVKVTGATDTQAQSGSLYFAYAVTNGGAVTATVSENGTPAQALTTGTLTVTFSASNTDPILIKATATTSISSPVISVAYHVEGQGGIGIFTSP